MATPATPVPDAAEITTSGHGKHKGNSDFYRARLSNLAIQGELPGLMAAHAEVPAAATLIGHIPEAERLNHAVAVLMQCRTFPITGVELEHQLELLLGVNQGSCPRRKDAALRRCLALDESRKPISELSADEAIELVERAHGHAVALVARIRELMETRHGSVREALRIFRRNRHGEQRLDAMHLVDTSLRPEQSPGFSTTSWSEALTKLGLDSKGAEGFAATLQLLGGRLEPAVLPYPTAVLRLGGIPTAALAELRQQLLAKHRTLPRMISAIGEDQAISLDAFQHECTALARSVEAGHADEPLAAHLEKYSEFLFAACDGNCGGTVDIPELQNAFSIAAPPTNLEQMRTKVLLRWGSWHLALTDLGIGLDSLVNSASLIALAVPLDICSDDALEIFRQISSAQDVGNENLSWANFIFRLHHRAEGFTLHELSLRLWFACESGHVPTEKLSRLQIPGDLTLPPETFASGIFGITISDQVGDDNATAESYRAHLAHAPRPVSAHKPGDGSSIAIPGADIRPGSAKKPGDGRSHAIPGADRGQRTLAAHPPLSGAEVLAAYRELWHRYKAVTLNLLQSELAKHQFVGDVLALDRGSASPGETVLIRYRVPQAAQHQLMEHPFVGMVPRGLTYVAGGGGCWTFGKKPVTDFPWPKVLCKGHREGTLSVQIPIHATSHDSDHHLEFRLFSSPDGVKPGKQVGGPVRFEFQAPQPRKPLVTAEALTHTSLKLFWEPHQSHASGHGIASYIVRGWPVGLQVEEKVGTEEGLKTAAWSHQRQEMVTMHSHEIRNLRPGLKYCFQVSALQQAKEAEVSHSRTLAKTTSQALEPDSPKGHPPASIGVVERQASAPVQITLPAGPTFVPAPGPPELVERGLAGDLILQWAVRANGHLPSAAPEAPAVDFKLLWDVQQEQCEPAYRSHGRAFWFFPGRYWTRVSDDGTVECLVRLPGRVDLGSASFCVAASSKADDLEAVSEPGEKLPLLTRAEEVLRDSSSARALGEIALAHGGLPSLLEAMADRGLTGDASKDHYLRLRQALMQKVGEAGGLDAFTRGLQGVEMASFEDSCNVLRSIQRRSGRKVDAPAWDALLHLVEEGGGPSAFAAGLGELSVRELIAAGPSLAKAGLVRNRSASPEEKGLLGDPRRAELLGALADCLDTASITISEVQSLTKALSTMVQAEGDADDWDRCMSSVIMSGGPGDSSELLEFVNGNVRQLLSALKVSGLDMQQLHQLLTDLQAACFVGPGSDKVARHSFFRRVNDAGGAPMLYRTLHEFDLRALKDGMQVLRTAGLDRVSAEEESKASLWCKLASAVQNDWNGIEAALEQFTGEAMVQKSSTVARRAAETTSLMQSVERNGGMRSVNQLLQRMDTVGGADKFLNDLGNLDIAYVPPILRDVRKLGCTLVELERMLQCVNQAGGVRKVLASLESIDDLGRFPEIVEHAISLENQLKSIQSSGSKCSSAAQGAILCKVLGDTTGETFLQAFTSVNLGSLVGLLPLLTSAGLLRKPGDTAVEAFLRWAARAGGVQRLSAALECVDPRLFTKCMDIVRSAGIGRMSEASMRKVCHWLERDVKPGGGLELLIDTANGADLFRMCKLLVRLDAADQNAGDPKAVEIATALPLDRLAAAHSALEELVDIAVAAGGAARLARLLGQVDLQFLEPMVDHLVAAELHKPGISGKPIKELFQSWKNVSLLASSVGGAAILYQKAAAVDIKNIDICLEMLQAAGLANHPPGMNDELAVAMAQWRDAIKVIAASGGPGFLLENLQNVDFRRFVQMIGLLRTAGLATPQGTPTADDCVGRGLLEEFVSKVVEAGGFNTFWVMLKKVDLTNLRDDLYCLRIIRRRLSQDANCPEEMWRIATDPDRLDALLESVGGQRRQEDLSAKQRERVVQKLRTIGGVDRFLEEYDRTDLKQAAEQLRALEQGGVSSPEVISELARLGQMVQHDLRHLQGLGEVVGTLVKWIQNRDDSNAAMLWHTLNEQVVWLLTAITENGAMVRAVSRRSSAGGVGERQTTQQGARQEPELTPARLAQFLQALRPLGGVRGFLAAYRGLDLPTAAAQARVLYDASVRTVDTARHLANVFRLLHYDTAQLLGLEHFVRHFGATVMVDVRGDKLKVGERWQVLTDCLKVAAHGGLSTSDVGPASLSGITAVDASGASEQDSSKLVGEGTFSGPDHVRDVLALGLQLSSAAGLDAVPEEWAALCTEIKTRSGGLGDVLTELRGTQGAKAAPAQTLRQVAKHPARQRVLECGRCGTRLNYRMMPRACSVGSLRVVGAARADHDRQSGSQLAPSLNITA